MIEVHSSWRYIVDRCYNALDPGYRNFLENDTVYFPDISNFLNAFKTLALDDTKYILFGQDPYPRRESAIGYAFIDGAVDEIFSDQGLSRQVNRATSLRNFIKMLLVADGRLSPGSTTQEEISKIPKDIFISSILELRDNFEKNGILLLNTSLIFTSKKDTLSHVKAFIPFMNTLLKHLQERNIEIILFGNIANTIEKKLSFSHKFSMFKTQHPYNVSFIENKEVQEFFRPMKLLYRDK